MLVEVDGCEVDAGVSVSDFKEVLGVLERPCTLTFQEPLGPTIAADVDAAPTPTAAVAAEAEQEAIRQAQVYVDAYWARMESQTIEVRCERGL